MNYVYAEVSTLPVLLYALSDSSSRLLALASYLCQWTGSHAGEMIYVHIHGEDSVSCSEETGDNANV